jgi:hypothetical protein
MAEVGDLGLALQHQRQAGSVGGLGAMFDPLRREKIASEAQYAGARMADVLAQARQRQYDEAEKQHQRAARHSLADRQRSGGDQELGDYFDAYDNPEQIAAAREKFTHTKAMQQAIDLANAPSVDYNHLNALKMATSATPTELVRSLGDGSYTHNAYRTDTPVDISQIGQAFIGEKRALAGEHNAQAERARAGIGADKAANYEIVDTPIGKVRVNKLNPNDTAPVLLNGEPVAKPATTGRGFTEPELSAVVGTGDGRSLDPIKLDAFLAKKHAMPNATDTDAYASLKADQDQAAQEGPPKELAGDGGSFLGKLFGGGAAAPAAPAAAPAAPAAKAPQFIEGKVYIDGNGRKAIYRNGQFVEQ